MNRTAALWPAASKFRSMRLANGRWEAGKVGTLTPKKLPGNESAERQVSKVGAEPDPIVAFSRPPPLPPVLGPIFAFTLLDSWLKHDSEDD